MDNKAFIYHLIVTDDDRLPCGQYFIDKETKKLYVSPIDKEKWEAIGKRYSNLGYIFTPLAVVGAMHYGEDIGTAIAQNSIFENILLLLAPICVLLAFFVWFKIKSSKMERALVKEAGYKLIACGKAEEIDFLELVLRHCKRIVILYILSFVFMCIIGYAAIVLSPVLPTGFVVAPFFAFIIPTTFFALFTVKSGVVMTIIPTVNTRLSILKEGEQK